MTQRFLYPFTPVVSTAPAFQVSGTLASTANALEGANRKWQGASGRTIRFAESSGIDYYVKFGSSTVVAAATDSMLLLGGTVQDLKQPKPSDTYVAIKSISTSTAAVVNVTLGYGG